MNSKLTDSEILELVASSKDAGFKILMQQYQESIYWHIRRMVITHEDADDVVQNTFIKVYKNIGSFKAESKLYTWIYRIATNESITFLNKRNRKRTESIDNDDVSLENQLTADEFFDGDEAQLILQQAIIKLPAKQKAVFNMRYFEEKSYKDISSIMETSVGALKASYHHAVKKIEESIKNRT